MPKKALIAGASGLVGGYLLDFLLESDRYDEIKVLTRRNLGKTSPKLTEIVIDFERLGNYSNAFEVDDVFCSLGITKKKAGSVEKARRVEFDYPLQMAQIASEQGARQFIILSSLGANLDSKNYYFRTKGELEQALQVLDIPSLHILRPSLLLGPRNEIRLGEDFAKVINTAFSFFIPIRYRGIQARTVAKFMQLSAEKNTSGQFIHESEVIRRIEHKFFDFQKIEERTEYREDV